MLATERAPSPKLTWKLPGPLLEDLVPFTEAFGSFHVSLRECKPVLVRFLGTSLPAVLAQPRLILVDGKGSGRVSGNQVYHALPLIGPARSQARKRSLEASAMFSLANRNLLPALVEF